MAGAGSAAAGPEKKQVQMTLCKPDKIWSVTFTHINDCYKRHYGWTDGPFLFSTSDAANEFYLRKLMAFCCDRLFGSNDEKLQERYTKLYDKFKETGTLPEMEIIEFTKELAEGEFVSDTLTWEVKMLCVDETPMPTVEPLEESEEESEAEEEAIPDSKKRAAADDSKDEQPSAKKRKPCPDGDPGCEVLH